MSTKHKRPRPRFFVATYGSMGLDVTFYQTEKEYDAAMEDADAEHRFDRLDTYTGGEVAL